MQKLIPIKTLCIVLAAIMVFAMIPAGAFAAEALDDTASTKELEDYNSHDVGVINNIIANNSLKDYPQNDPYWWDFANWSNDSTNKRLTHLIVYGDGLTGTLDLSGCNALEYLECQNNRLTGINVSGCSNLEVLWCENNRLTSINVSGLKKLDSLSVSDNQLTKLDVSGCVSLDALVCESNQLTSLNVAGLQKLRYLSFYLNSVKSIDVSKCPSLETIRCWNNRLTTLNVSGLKKLKELHCTSNEMTSLDASGCTALTDLDCYYNPMASLKLPDGYTLTIAPVTGIKVTLDRFSLYTREVSLEATPYKSFTQWSISPSVKYTSGDQNSSYIRFIMPKANVKVTPANVSSGTVKVTGVKLSKATLALVKGKSATLKVTVAPAKATNTKVTWSTSDKKIATVNSNGVVKAIKKGKATITVKTSNGKKATCAVTVK